MYRLSSSYSPDASSLHSQNLPSLFSLVSRLPYIRDIDETGNVSEILKRPRITLLEGGDCDDKTILAGAAFNASRRPWRIVTASYHPDNEMEHVYAEVLDERSGLWTPFDATYPSNVYGVERPYISKLVWSNPMQTTRLGVTTLEGVGPLGQSPASSFFSFLTTAPSGSGPVTPSSTAYTNLFTSILQSAGAGGSAITSESLPAAGAIVGSIVPGVGTATGGVIGGILSSLGITIKGPTQHLSYEDANKAANAFAKNVYSFIQSLPADARTFAYGQVQQFYKRFLADFGSWWGGALKDYDAQNHARGWFSTPDGELYYSLFDPAYIILFNADKTTVEQDFNNWYYVGHFKPLVADPLAQYLKDKLGELVSSSPSGAFVVNPGSGGSPITSSLASSGGLIALAGIALLASVLPRRRRAARRRRR